MRPSAELPEGWQERGELEWISRRRECRQLVAWFGQLAVRPGERRATVLDPLGLHPRTLAAKADAPIAVAPRIGRYIFEPDSAVLAAGLSGVLAALHAVSAVAAGVSYFTGDRAIDDPALACFEVLETMPLRASRIKDWLAARGIGRLEIKKRGVDADPETLRKELRLTGPDEATLLLAPVNGKAMAILARRVSADSEATHK